MAVYATARPVRELSPETYTCSRCGITRSMSSTAKTPELCRDCRDVRALDLHRAVADAYESGMSAPKIAAEFGMGCTTVYQVVKRMREGAA